MTFPSPRFVPVKETFRFRGKAAPVVRLRFLVRLVDVGISHCSVVTRLLLLCVFGLLAGCADFEHLNTSPFHDAFQGVPGGGRAPTQPPAPPNKDEEEKDPGTAEQGPCIDPDPAVIATCIKITDGLAPLTGMDAVLVAERSTGNILLAKRGPVQTPSVLAHIDVDSHGDGGLMDIAVSPDFATDATLFVYLSTPRDNRVVSLSKAGGAKEILTGIPHGQTGNNGSLQFGPGGALYVLTGDAGDPETALDPTSRAGKILRIEPTDLSGDGESNPSTIVSGIGGGGALCFDLDDPDTTLWYTNRAGTKDEFLRLPKNSSQPQLVWSWPNKPGIFGCVVKKNIAFVAVHDQLFTVIMPKGASGLPSEPLPTLEPGKYGILGDVTASPSGTLCFGTVNRADGGTPNENVDDRVICSANGGGGGGNDGPPGFGAPPTPKDD